MCVIETEIFVSDFCVIFIGLVKFADFCQQQHVEIHLLCVEYGDYWFVNCEVVTSRQASRQTNQPTD